LATCTHVRHQDAVDHDGEWWICERCGDRQYIAYRNQRHRWRYLMPARIQGMQKTAVEDILLQALRQGEARSVELLPLTGLAARSLRRVLTSLYEQKRVYRVHRGRYVYYGR